MDEETGAGEGKEGGVEGGIMERKVWEEAEFWCVLFLSALLNVQQLPFILLKLPMEFKMTVALFIDRGERSKFGSVLGSRLVLIRF